MSLSSAAVAQAAALPLPGLLPPPALAHRSLVIVAAGGRDLVWPQERIASAQQLGWRVQSLAADWRRHGRAAGPIRNRLLLEQALVEAQAHTFPAFSASVLVIAFPGGAGTASLVQQARSCSSRSPVPVVVMEVPPPFSPEPLAA
jgi:hypothetical protein